MKIYNSLSNQLEHFVSIKENELSMYVCGPTVYNDPHIGNARPLIVFDMVYRVFKQLGYDVHYVSNYTDIDDRIILKAIEENVTAKDISERYINAYRDVADALNVVAPNTIQVTDTIPQINDYIQMLVDEGYAYAVGTNVYFRVSKIKDYGKLSKQNVDDLLVGARIEENSEKENPLDFTLWKETKVGEVYASNFGEGRPGWHTECVVMIKEKFNGPIDIHGGGLDLKFPHHENELAQVIDGTNLANYWMHNGLININNEKMSKSQGTVILAKDMVKDYGAAVVRWLLLSTHYRSPLNLTDEYIKQAQAEIVRLTTSLNKVRLFEVQFDHTNTNEIDEAILNEFMDQLKQDFNTANAYKVIFDTLKLVNSELRNRSAYFGNMVRYSNTLLKMLDILGIKLDLINPSKEDLELISAWEEAKLNKDFERADTLRAQLMEKGLI